LFAGETGKIAGKIIDKTTEEALIGANILITGVWIEGVEQPLEFTYGAASDVEGNYFILNVPPGSYTVKASYIGYTSSTVTSVQVDIDKTTMVDFNLTLEGITTEEVLVTAYSPTKVERDRTATKQVYNVRDIESIGGVVNIEDILELQADVVDDHFRGGRVGESLYLVSGGSINNPLTNSRAFSPIVLGLEQVEVYTSGFSAEYGNAQSGVVNMVARQGGDVWETRLEVAGIPSYFKTWGGSPYSTDNLYFYNMLWQTEAWLQENPTQPGRSLFDAGYGFGPLYLPPRNTWPPDPLTLADSLHIAKLGQTSWYQAIRDVGLEYADNTPDYRLRFTTSGPIFRDLKFFVAAEQNTETAIVPTPDKNTYRQLMSNLSYQLDNSNKFQVRFIYDYQFDNILNSNWLRWMFDRTFSVTKASQKSFQYGFTWNHIFNPSTVFDLKLNILSVNSRENVDLLRNDQFIEDYSSGTNWVDYTGPSGHRVGRPNDDRVNNNILTYDIHTSILSQFNNNNLVKAGFQFIYYELNVDEDLNLANIGSYSKVKYASYPYEGGLYIQDKMEYAGFVANIGLRWDFYNFNKVFYSDIYSPLRNPNYDPDLPYLERGQYYDPELAETEETQLYTRLQPRIGLSFPLTEVTVFHLNYGTFTQRPSFDAILSQEVSSNGIVLLGNARLKPENTRSYDVGLVNAFPLGIVLDVSAYYKDVTDLIETAYFFDEQQAVYQTYINRDYADIKGFHVSLEKNQGALRGFLRYNYETATGKSSNGLDAPLSFFENPAEGQDPVDLPDPEDIYLDYDRTHKAVFNIRYLFPRNVSPRIGDFSIFGDMSISLTYRYYSGRPYTFLEEGRGILDQRTPEESDLRMRIEKNFRIGQSVLNIFLEGFNLLNEEIFHYSRTFDDSRNTAKWELDNENVLVYDQFPPFFTDQSVHLLTNQPRHFRLGVSYRF
jgi:outer membrane receptor protein involved in Fe transport